MWTPKDLFYAVRRSFATRTEPAPVTETYRRHPQGEVFARAMPETVRIVETYSYQQEISRNRELNSDPTRPPKGRLTVAVPFDGDHFFSRQAKSDVAAQIPPNHPEPTWALVGHVVLANCGKTDFRLVGTRNGDTTAIPIRVPVSGPGIPLGYDHLIDDRGSCVLTHEYGPDPSRPEIMPVTVSIELRDPDSADFLEISGLSDVKAKVVAEKLRTQRVFQPYLELRVKVEVHITGDELTDPPEVSVSIAWPTVTSPSFFSLLVSGKDYPLRYNPVGDCIEWRNVALKAVKRKGAKQAKDKDVADDPVDDKNEVDEAERAEPEQDDTESDNGGADDEDEAAADNDDEGEDEDEDEDDGERDEQGAVIRTYASPTMSLLIQQPGELYQEKELKATVDVWIPRLLSGMSARLYGGTGRHAKEYTPEVASEVSTQIRVILGDAFADRIVSTSQHLHFDEVTLDSARIEDIKNALVADGFEHYHERLVSSDPEIRLLFYRRREGADHLQLGYLLEGTQYTTERETVIGGETFTTSLQSGDLRVYSYGTMRRSSREITRAMNRLHQVLRTQFAHVRVRR
jgi:hypothetical protein